MQLRGPTFLVAALIVVAALVLHELRYLIGYGGDASEALAAQGHGYITAATTGAIVLLAIGAAQLLLTLRRALRSAAAGPQVPFGLLWLGAICALLALYSSQELLEGLLSTGHPDGFAALAAQGGWSAIPLSVALGGVVALLLRGAAAAEAIAAGLGRRRSARRAPAPSAARPAFAAAALPLESPLARKRASRAPPALSAAG